MFNLNSNMAQCGEPCGHDAHREKPDSVQEFIKIKSWQPLIFPI